MVNRRQFLATTAASAAASCVPAIAVAAAGPTVRGSPGWRPATLRERLRALVGARVVVESPAGRNHATVVDLEEGPASPGLDQFSIRLDVADGGTLGEGVYRVSHRAIEPLELHLQPAGASGLRATFALLEAT